MEYFRTLNLDQEPFSNSPDPGLFYESTQHLYALQQLEIAIRLKRGLNIITGEVGTGKTTVSRQLIQKITHDPDIHYALILDPGFTSETDFLSCLLKSFTGRIVKAQDENTIKEEIKNFLFLEGVEKKRTLVLIIDEGQKLPVFCLEVLRELLNYETNDQKLLQIVIFAQKEFETLIKPLEYFQDRINFQYSFKPLGLTETKGLIQYRLKQSVQPGHHPLHFSLMAYYCIYRHTRGYPRKIINLCHHIILALIVHDKNKAGYFFVRQCSHRVFLTSDRRIGYTPVLISLLIVAGSMIFFRFPDMPGLFHKKQLPMATEKIQNNAPQKADQKRLRFGTLKENSLTKPYMATSASAAQSSQHMDRDLGSATFDQKSNFGVEQEHPLVYGRLSVTPNATLSKMMESVYGLFTPDYLEKLLAVNPEIKNPNLIQIGTELRFPVVNMHLNEWDKKAYCLIVAKTDNFYDAYKISRDLKNSKFQARLVHTWNHENGFFFYVIVNRFFDSLKEAEHFNQSIAGIQAATPVVAGSIIQGSQ